MLMGIGFAISSSSISKNTFPYAEVESLIKSFNKKAILLIDNWHTALTTDYYYSNKKTKAQKALLAIRVAKKNALSFILDKHKIEGVSNITGTLGKELNDPETFENLLKCIVTAIGFNEIIIFKHQSDTSINFVSMLSHLKNEATIEIIEENAEMRTKGAAMLILEDRFLKYE